MVVTFLFFFTLFFIVLYSWDAKEYMVFDRLTQDLVSEVQPQMVAKGVASVYTYPHMAVDIKMNPLFEWATKYCGDLYNKQLDSDGDRYRAIQQAFVEEYNVDMTLFSKPSYTQYNSVNEWFFRQLRAGVRPVAYPSDDTIVVSPADCRLVAFTNVPPDQQVWIKGSRFDLQKLVGGVAPDYYFGSMIIARLAPQDYHRFHSPVAGTIVDQYYIEGSLQSVNSDAMTSDNDAIYNQRMVTIIQTTNFGKVAFVAIGAVCVGSIQMTKNVSTVLAKGDELGFFAFGGSTIAVVFPGPGNNATVTWDSDILLRSTQSVETYVTVRSRIGKRRS